MASANKAFTAVGHGGLTGGGNPFCGINTPFVTGFQATTAGSLSREQGRDKHRDGKNYGDRKDRFRRLGKLEATCLGVGSDGLNLLICEMGTIYAGEDRTPCVTQTVGWKCSQREKAAEEGCVPNGDCLLPLGTHPDTPQVSGASAERGKTLSQQCSIITSP